MKSSKPLKNSATDKIKKIIIMKKIYILLKCIGAAIDLRSASFKKEYLQKILEKEVREHIEDFYNENDEYDADYREILLERLEKSKDYWTDGDEECELQWRIEEVILSDTPKPKKDASAETEQTKPLTDARLAVAEMIIGQLENNVLQDNGFESFERWCDDGEVFENFPDLSKNGREIAVSIMHAIAPHVDQIGMQLNMNLPL